jgi:hypothetical protein
MAKQNHFKIYLTRTGLLMEGHITSVRHLFTLPLAIYPSTFVNCYGCERGQNAPNSMNTSDFAFPPK